LLKAFGWPLYELDDYEADDILGTLAHQAKQKDIETMLVTSDLDVLQLINSHINAYILKKGLSNIELLDPKSFEAKYGIPASKFLDYKALAGDSSDNIPGVPSIGPKTAIDLLKEYKDIDDIYENLDLLKSNLKDKLVAGKDLAYLSKKLAEIWIDAPIKLNLKEVDGSKSDPAEIQRILKQLEFRSLLAKLPEVFKVPDALAPTNNQNIEVGKNKLINTDSELDELNLSSAKHLVIYGRSAQKHGRDPRLLVISPDPKNIYTILIPKLSKSAIAAKLGPLFASSEVTKSGYDIKNSIKVGYSLGLDLVNVSHDVQIAAFLLNPLNKANSLSELAENNLGYEGSSLDDMDEEELLSKVPEIISVIRGLEEIQVAELKNYPKIKSLANDIEFPVIPVLADMEYVGIKLDTEQLEVMSDKLKDKLSYIEQSIYGYANQEFNINSPSQLADILFKNLNLPTTGIKKGKSGYSTASKELDKLRGSHPVIDLITEYRELTKLQNTYVETLPKMVDKDSRLHTTFNLTVAQTGRLSSTDPNLQNIPVRTDLGKEIRAAFVASEHNKLVSADYSQFELRIAAYLSGDEEMIEQFNNDADIHTLTAAQIHGRNPEDVTKQMRRTAKAINFGILYGMSPHGLSVATGMTQVAAKSFIDKYYEIRKPLINYMNGLREKAAKDGYVEDFLSS
ncbi:MAG TPA: DNA polymerase I, partial [Candidatus Saccharimonadales bacterium]|nr:DNA polymerase I [Candidatus Saccharimonadales bacterium]